MKKYLYLLVIIYFVFYTSIYAQENNRRYGIVFEMGPFFSVNGTYSDSENLRDIVNPGPVFSFGLKMKVNNQYFVEMLITNGWMNFKDSKKPTSGLSPSYAVTNINFDNIYYIYQRHSKIKLLIGPGIYYWRFTNDGPFSRIQEFEGEKFNKMSIGGDIGLGFEIDFNKNVSLSLTTRYHYILSKDKFFFGNDFSEQGLLDIKSGISYYFDSLF